MAQDEAPRRWTSDKRYSPQFILSLGQEFEFDGADPGIIAELNYVRTGFAMARATDNFPDYARKVRDIYLEIKRGIEAFRDLLNTYESQDLASDMDSAARMLGEPRPQTVFRELTEFEATRGKPFLLELLRLLRILEAGAQRHVDRLAPIPGRKKDLAVETLIRRAAEVWEGFLRRKFTVDYHRGAGLTPAFQFVKRLINDIEPTPDTTIITYMRAEIKSRKKYLRNDFPGTKQY